MSVKIHFLPKVIATNAEIRFGNNEDFQELCNSPGDSIFTCCIFDFELSKFPYLQTIINSRNNQTIEIYPKEKNVDPFGISGTYLIQYSLIKTEENDEIYTALFKDGRINNFSYKEYRNIEYPLLRIRINARERIIERIKRTENKWIYDRDYMLSEKNEQYLTLKTKSFFIEVFNTFLREGLEVDRIIQYDDISSYFIEYVKKDRPLYLCLYLFTAKNDYIILFDIFFTKEVREKVEESTAQYKKEFGRIDCEEKLNKVVLFAISLIKHETDNRRLYAPFWDNLSSTPSPKREAEIQPTLAAFLRVILEREFGVDISSNVDEGIGYIDYKFSYSHNNAKYIVVAELKLADHKNLWHCLESQLPAYMKGVKANHGIFWILWNKTPKVHEFPKKYKTLREFDEEMKERVKEINEKKGFKIVGISCDISIRPSASRL